MNSYFTCYMKTPFFERDLQCHLTFWVPQTTNLTGRFITYNVYKWGRSESFWIKKLNLCSLYYKIYIYLHRYLYVNCRQWPKNYSIENPFYPPPIAQEIDIHVIDLMKMKRVGTMHQAHKAYTSNDECFFIFLDVSNEYVARYLHFLGKISPIFVKYDEPVYR